MKTFIIVLSFLCLVSCATQRTTTSFTTTGSPVEYHHMTQIPIVIPIVPVESPAPVLLASTSAIVLQKVQSATPVEFKKVYLSLSKHQKKEFRHELKKELKTYLKNKKSGLEIQSTQSSRSGMDHDLKLALIFGIVGILVLSFIPGQAFVIIGSILLIVGIVFFIKWLINL